MMKSLILSLCLLVSVSAEGNVTYHATAEDPCVIKTPDGTINIGHMNVSQFTMNINDERRKVYWMIGWCKEQVNSPPVVDGYPRPSCAPIDLPSFLTQHDFYCEFSTKRWNSGITATKVGGTWIVSYTAGKPAKDLIYPGRNVNINIECSPTISGVVCGKFSPYRNCLTDLKSSVVSGYHFDDYTATFKSRHACPN
eukprot:TRINITY_DN2737_c0_g1_i1.p1 TRINITY_DN2737_c0_g1~~TRINITY_DN2737_c0_g1_i1.p1  ORF type:complete len:210 (+),score=25.54 TRINITY_DN2737_c0_g1_i1:43-630(+)